MSIYSKTMAGRVALVDLGSALAPELKTFLKNIDGKTSAEELLAEWRGGPDPIKLLLELEREGLVEIRAARWSNSQSNSQSNSHISSQNNLANDETADFLPRASSIYGMGREPARTVPISAKVTYPYPLAELSRIKEQMANFMLTYLPHHSGRILKEIDGINTYDELRNILEAYAHFVYEAGHTGLAHIKLLRSMLDPDFQDTAY